MKGSAISTFSNASCVYRTSEICSISRVHCLAQFARREAKRYAFDNEESSNILSPPLGAQLGKKMQADSLVR